MRSPISVQDTPKPRFKDVLIKEFELHVQDKLEQNFSQHTFAVDSGRREQQPVVAPPSDW